MPNNTVQEMIEEVNVVRRMMKALKRLLAPHKDILHQFNVDETIITALTELRKRLALVETNNSTDVAALEEEVNIQCSKADEYVHWALRKAAKTLGE
jgi:hypothetical protein